MSKIDLSRFPKWLLEEDVDIFHQPPPPENKPVVGYRYIHGKLWRIVDGVPERELTEEEARDIQYGIWP